MSQNRDINGDFHFPRGDQYTECTGVIDSAHLKVHEGKSYFFSYLNAAVASAANVDILLNNPASNYPHITTLIGAGGNSSVAMFEGVTTSADGTALNVFNRSRSNTNTASLVVSHTPTITDLGTEIFDSYVFGGEKSKATGGSDGFAEEIILKPNTKYLIRITNDSGASEVVVVDGHFYEA